MTANQAEARRATEIARLKLDMEAYWTSGRPLREYSSVAREELRGRASDDILVISSPVKVGHLARRRFHAAIDYGRSLGLEIELFKGRADLAQRCWAYRAKGRWADLRRLGLALENMNG